MTKESDLNGMLNFMFSQPSFKQTLKEKQGSFTEEEFKDIATSLGLANDKSEQEISEIYQDILKFMHTL